MLIWVKGTNVFHRSANSICARVYLISAWMVKLAKCQIEFQFIGEIDAILSTSIILFKVSTYCGHDRDQIGSQAVLVSKEIWAKRKSVGSSQCSWWCSKISTFSLSHFQTFTFSLSLSDFSQREICLLIPVQLVMLIDESGDLGRDLVNWLDLPHKSICRWPEHLQITRIFTDNKNIYK